uniref:DNA/RNA non-specific endonuclease domain-containing protein n=1 Tax=Strigamia maritima TaxID=126957 RepID=T1J8W2_STRMM
MFQAYDEDYSRISGFIKGQLAPWKNHTKIKSAYMDTYFLSNMAPQIELFNTRAWYDLECFSRYLTSRNNCVYVFTGPLFIPQTEYNTKYQVIGPNHVAVPTHFFKVIICEPSIKGNKGLACYIMPNMHIADCCPLKAFRVRLQDLQEKAGILFFNSCEQFDEIPDVCDFRRRKVQLMESVGLGGAI